jgi:hypothetical protein
MANWTWEGLRDSILRGVAEIDAAPVHCWRKFGALDEVIIY